MSSSLATRVMNKIGFYFHTLLLQFCVLFVSCVDVAVVVVLVVVVVGTVSVDGMVSFTSLLSIDLMCSISMSEQLSEFDSAESIEVMVMSTALSLALGESRGFSTAGLVSPSISSSRG